MNPTSDGFRLDGGGETLVFACPDQAMPQLIYWGPSLGQSVEGLMILAERAVPHGMLDGGETLSWLPEQGQGFSGHPALMAHRGGLDLITQFSGVVRQDSPGEVEICLTDEIAQAVLILRLRLDPETGVLTSQTEVINRASDALTLNWLAAAALPSPHAEIMAFDGRWTREFQPVRQHLSTGQIVKENRTGRTSHHAPPFMVIGEPGFGQGHGEVFGLHLGWSGDHRMMAERLRDGRIQLQAGELLRPGEIILGEGQPYRSPTLHMARSDAGLNGLSDRIHPYVRQTVLGGRRSAKPRPVHYNSWEAVYFDHDLARLKALAERAAQVGVERFVLDDGWFKGRPNDRSGLGDWSVDPVKYPDGLGPLIDHVQSLGMEFGLWVEPEMANLDSDLLRAHPDWILGDPRRQQRQ